jgi:hypothetical protein
MYRAPGVIKVVTNEKVGRSRKVANDRYRLGTVVMDVLWSFNFVAILY